MSITTAVGRFLGLLIIALAANQRVNAQQRVESNHSATAQRCAALAKKHGAPVALRSKADLMDAFACDVTGPEFLVESWEALPRDASSLNALYMVSATTADRRLLKRLMALAADTTRSFDDRMGAIGTLASYLNPSVRASMLNDPGAPGGRRVAIVMLSHPEKGDGSQPLTGADRDSIRLLCRRLGATDSIEDIRFAAQHVLKLSPKG